MASKELCQCPNCGSNLQDWFFEKMKDEISKLDLAIQSPNECKDKDMVTEKPIVDEPKIQTEKEPEKKPLLEISESESRERAFHDKSLRPALRGFILYWTYIMFCTFVVMFPLTAISIFMADDNIDKVGDWPWMISIIQILGLLVGIFYGSKILIQWLGHRYKLCVNSVETAEGIVARNKSSIRYGHIRSAEVKQGVIDRILDVGSVELATAGSSEVEIIFKGIHNPVAIQEEVNKRIAASKDRAED